MTVNWWEYGGYGRNCKHQLSALKKLLTYRQTNSAINSITYIID